MFSGDPEASVLNLQRRAALEATLRLVLDDTEVKVLRRAFGFDDRAKRRAATIESELGVGREIERSAMSKLTCSAVRDRLRPFLAGLDLDPVPGVG